MSELQIKKSDMNKSNINRPRVVVLSGYGLNCEEETKYAFIKSGGDVDIVHINDLIAGKTLLKNYQIMAIPGGFSFGDDTGSGNAYANRMRNHLWHMITEFIEEDKLIIGICNGFQILVNLGLLPALDNKYGERQVALAHNDSARYIDRWIDLKFEGSSPWTKGIDLISMPIAHGEGKFFASDSVITQIEEKKLVAARYVNGEMCKYANLNANPNGALHDIAAITDVSGKILGMMPHPERAIDFTQRPDWTLIKEQHKREGKLVPIHASGIKIFENGIKHFLQ